MHIFLLLASVLASLRSPRVSASVSGLNASVLVLPRTGWQTPRSRLSLGLERLGLG